MGRSVVVLVALCACGRVNFDPCRGSTFLDACGAGDGDDLVLDAGEFRYDTDAGTLARPSGELIAHTSMVSDGVRVVSAGRVLVADAATLRGFGSLPLAIVADDITVDGAIDVSGRAGERGAGGQACDAGVRVGSADGGGGGGGGGGGFGANGGSGGGGDGDDTGLPTGTSIPGAGGRVVSELGKLRGGCDGGDGGVGDGPAGIGGRAGGAILLHAPRTWITNATVRASGGGGLGALAEGGISDGGGGGGASGGMIVLEADELDLISGVIVANGGGGGEGGIGGEPGGDGSPGLDALDPAPGGGAGDGAEGDNGGAGGDHDSPDGKSPTGTLPSGGGGGGGGSVGVIVIRATVINYTGSRISPMQR